MSQTSSSRPLGDADILVRAAIVSLTVATAYLHLSLGGALFTLNAVGYFVGAAAMVAPIPIAVRYRWLVRIGLAGYAATTIAAWAIDPIFFSTAYLAKSIEVALIGLLAIDFVRRDGNPIERIRHGIRSLLGRPPAMLALAIVVLAACSAGSSGSGAQSLTPSIDPDALTIAADDLAFSTSTLSAPADEPFQIAFDNQESAPHNVAIYGDDSATEQVFGSDPFSGPAVVTYDVPALAPGSYFFRCDVHPDMAGELTVG